MRILTLNLYGIRPSNNNKLNMLIDICLKYKIDAMILSKTNAKQTSSNYEKIINKLRSLYRNIQLIIADSTDHELTDTDWLPGRLLIGIQENSASIIDTTIIYIDKLAKWTAYHITNRSKTIILNSIYRLP